MIPSLFFICFIFWCVEIDLKLLLESRAGKCCSHMQSLKHGSVGVQSFFFHAPHANKPIRAKGTNCVISACFSLLRTKKSISIEHSKRPNCFFLYPIIPKSHSKDLNRSLRDQCFGFSFISCVFLSRSLVCLSVCRRKKRSDTLFSHSFLLSFYF